MELSKGRPRHRWAAEAADVELHPVRRPPWGWPLLEQNALSWDPPTSGGERGRLVVLRPAEVGLVDPHAVQDSPPGVARPPRRPGACRAAAPREGPQAFSHDHLPRLLASSDCAAS